MSFLDGKSDKQLNAAIRARNKRAHRKLERKAMRKMLRLLRAQQGSDAVSREPQASSLARRITELEGKLGLDPGRWRRSSPWSAEQRRRCTRWALVSDVRIGLPASVDAARRNEIAEGIRERAVDTAKIDSLECRYVCERAIAVVTVVPAWCSKALNPKCKTARQANELRLKLCDAVASLIGEDAVAATRRGDDVDVGDLPRSVGALPIQTEAYRGFFSGGFADSEDDGFFDAAESGFPDAGTKPDDDGKDDETAVEGGEPMTNAKKPMGYEIHPLTEIFPEMSKDEFAEFLASFKLNGLLEPIVRLGGKVLDGRSRLRACIALGIEPQFVDYDGDDPVRFVWAKNFGRRHLTPAQKVACIKQYNVEVARQEARTRMLAGKKAPVVISAATVTAEVAAGDPGANLPQGQPTAKGPGKAVEKLAEALGGISPKTVQNGLQAIKKVPALQEYMRSGELSVNAAFGIANDRSLAAAVNAGEMTVMKAREAQSKKPKRPRLSRDGSMYPGHRASAFLVRIKINTGKGDADRRGEIVLAAFRAAYACVGDRPNVHVMVDIDGFDCHNPWHVPPLPEGFRMERSTTVVQFGAVDAVELECAASKEPTTRLAAEACGEDLAEELKSALLPDFDDLAKLD